MKSSSYDLSGNHTGLYSSTGQGILVHLHMYIGYLYMYSGTPLNGHPSTVDTYDITDNSECPDCISIDFNVFKPPQQRIPHYFV